MMLPPRLQERGIANLGRKKTDSFTLGEEKKKKKLRRLVKVERKRKREKGKTLVTGKHDLKSLHEKGKKRKIFDIIPTKGRGKHFAGTEERVPFEGRKREGAPGYWRKKKERRGSPA